MKQKPRIGVTMGDPAGVGPELCLRLLADPDVNETCQLVVFGDKAILYDVASTCDLTSEFDSISVDDLAEKKQDTRPVIVDMQILKSGEVTAGQICQQTGSASFAYIETAIDAALENRIDAICTGPINKEAWQAANIPFPGHTELFAQRSGIDEYCMMMTAEAFSCSLVTTHVGYHEVPNLLTESRILEVIRLTDKALWQIYGRKPKLLVLGLNPHAGEGGLFGMQEEERIIRPAVESALQSGIDIEGPLPPDTTFLPWRREQTDGYICMYHDQGLIPFKAFNFDSGVNITLGLPLIRTSVDHGTALDIAWQGIADVSSFITAVNLAARLSRNR